MSSTIITENTTTVTTDSAPQQRKRTLEYFEGAKSRRTFANLNAYRIKDRDWFPDLVLLLAQRGLIAGTLLGRLVGDAWATCPANSMTLSQWAELHNLTTNKGSAA